MQAAEVTISAPVIVNINATTLNVPGTVTIASSGTLQASTGAIVISNNGNWANSGTFTQGNSTVEFAGTSHSITGSATFYNLKCTVAGGQLILSRIQRNTNNPVEASYPGVFFLSFSSVTKASISMSSTASILSNTLFANHFSRISSQICSTGLHCGL